jgi:hypothetical protein
MVPSNPAVKPPTAGGAGAPPAIGASPVGGSGGGAFQGAGGASGRASEDEDCSTLDGGLPDAGMIDAGDDAALPNCDDDAGM